MKLSRWSRWVIPTWTFFFGMLIGGFGFSGGLTQPDNILAIALYVCGTAAILVPLEFVARRWERDDTDKM